jgi:hypothetical protein
MHMRDPSFIHLDPPDGPHRFIQRASLRRGETDAYGL